MTQKNTTMLSQLSLDLLLSDDTPAADTTPEAAFEAAADVLAGKWTAAIIRELLKGTKRYSQLQSALSGVSPKILTARLRMLEAEGLVSRKVYATVPPKAEYRLTETGRELHAVVTAMEAFGNLLLASRKD